MCPAGVRTVFVSVPPALLTDGSLIDFEAFGIGPAQNPLVIGAATLSAAPGLGIADVSAYGASGTEVAGNTLIPFATGSFPADGYSAISIKFATPVRAIGLGWFDPNLPDNWFRAFDQDDNLLVQGQPATGDSGGGTASFVGAVADCAAIARVEIAPSDSSDWYAIDNIRIVP
jgi:hypothetical protein